MFLLLFGYYWTIYFLFFSNLETGVLKDEIGTCSKSCGGGKITKQTKCVPPANYNGEVCYVCPEYSQKITVEDCNTHACPTTITKCNDPKKCEDNKYTCADLELQQGEV